MAGTEEKDNLKQGGDEDDSSKIGPVETIIVMTVSIMSDAANAFASMALALSSGGSAAVAGVSSFIPFAGWIIGGAVSGGILGLGLTTYFVCKGFSLLIWVLLMLWSGFRVSKGGLSVPKKILSLVAGRAIDELTFGFLFGQSIMLAVSIYLNNHPKGGVLGKSLGALK